MGSAGAIEQTAEARASRLARLPPAMPAAMRRRRGDAEGRRRSLHAHSPLDCLHKRQPTGQSELGVAVKRHPGPSLGRESWQTHSLKEAPMSPQPFTTCVGVITSEASRVEARPGVEGSKVLRL